MKASSPLGFDGVSNHYSRPIILLSERESRKAANFLEPLCVSPLQTAKHFAARILAMLVNNLINHPVFLRLLGIHDVVALDILLNPLHRLPAVL